MCAVGLPKDTAEEPVAKVLSFTFAGNLLCGLRSQPRREGTLSDWLP